MSLQPPPEYIPDPNEQRRTAPHPGASAAPHPVAPQQDAPATPASLQPQASPRRELSFPPAGMDVVGGTTVQLNRVVALDRLASGHGFLTIQWPVHQRGYDLLSLHDRAMVSARSASLALDVSAPFGRLLVATGTRGTTTLPPSELRVSNGATTIIVPIAGGTSLGVWPRLSISKVDEFVVIRHEQDMLSGNLSAVAEAYGFDERNFTLAKA